ncbi:MAG: hypothetical protein WCJ25_04405 [Candidatus Moraniibacteriota bacterium]
MVSAIGTRFGLTETASAWVRILFEREETEIRQRSLLRNPRLLAAWLPAWFISVLFSVMLVNPELGVRVLDYCGFHPESSGRLALATVILVWCLFVSSQCWAAVECQWEASEEPDRKSVLFAYSFFSDPYEVLPYLMCVVPLIISLVYTGWFITAFGLVLSSGIYYKEERRLAHKVRDTLRAIGRR